MENKVNMYKSEIIFNLNRMYLQPKCHSHEKWHDNISNSNTKDQVLENTHIHSPFSGIIIS